MLIKVENCRATMMKHESRHDHGSTSNLTVAALGVVYGDIGTSPLYAFKQSIEAIGGPNWWL